MGAPVTSESKLSTGYLTVLPKEIRIRVGAREGDSLRWELRGTELMVRVRKRRTLSDVTGIGAHGGDAVASKRAVQGLGRRVR